jgi:hypothetical protein
MTEDLAVAETVEAESPSEEATPVEVPESPSGEPSDEAKTDEPESPSEKAAEADAEPEEWKNLLGKHNGNKKAAAEHYWKTQKDNANLAKENKELKAYREQAERSKNEKPAEPHPTLKEADSRITALTKEISTDLPRQELELFKDLRKHEDAIAVLTDRLANADALEKEGIEIKLDNAKVRWDLTERKIREVQYLANQKSEHIERLKNYKADFEKQQAEERANKERQEENRQRFNEDFPNEIEGYIAQHAKSLGFPGDMDDLKTDVYEYVMAFAAQFRGTETPVDQQDWSALVKAKVERETKKADKLGRAHYAKVSKEVKPKTTPVVVKPSASDKPNGTPKHDDGITPGMRAARERLAKLGI